MCIDNAHPAFRLELILVLFGEKPTERGLVVPFATTEPVIDKWLIKIVVWRCRADAIEIDFIENKISHVQDVLSAEVAPEVCGAFDVAVGGDRTKAVCEAIDPAPRSAAKSCRPPIQVIAVGSVIRMAAWEATNESFKLIEGPAYAVSLRVFIPHPVQGEFEPIVPESSYEAEILMILQCGTCELRAGCTCEWPDGFRRPQPQVAQQLVDRANIVGVAPVGVVEDRESKLPVARKSGHWRSAPFLVVR